MKRREALAAIALAPLMRPGRVAWIEWRGDDLWASCSRAAAGGVSVIHVASHGKRLFTLERRHGWGILVGDNFLEVEL